MELSNNSRFILETAHIISDRFLITPICFIDGAGSKESGYIVQTKIVYIRVVRICIPVQHHADSCNLSTVISKQHVSLTSDQARLS